MPENQTAWHSNNQGIKERVEPKQTSKAAECVGQLRKTKVRWWTRLARLAAGRQQAVLGGQPRAGCAGEADLSGN